MLQLLIFIGVMHGVMFLKVINEWCRITKVGAPDLQPTNQPVCEIVLFGSAYSCNYPG